MSRVLLVAPMSSVHERFNIANIRALKRMNCEVHLAANFSTDEHSEKYAETVRDDGAYVHNIPFERASLIKNIKTIPLIRSLIKSGKYDFVHCHTETGGILTRIACFGLRETSVLYTPHGMSFYKGSSFKSQLVYRPIERYICKGMKKVLTMNSEEFSTVSKWNKDKVVFVHGAGVDIVPVQSSSVSRTEKLTELGLDPLRKTVLSIGELNDNKNHKTVIDAISLMDESIRPQYLICGVGVLSDELIQYAENKGVCKNIFLAGYRYDIPDIVNVCDIFAFPSFHEGLSAALIQAMAAGLPVVCSEIRGNVDLIDEGRGGYLVRPDDFKAFRDCLTRLLGSPEKCVKFGEYNRNKVKVCSVENVTEELISIYSEFVGG